MKKLIFTLTVLLGLSLGTTNAQEVGKIWVGGSVGIYNSDVTDGDNYLNYNILPEVGYILTDNLGIGIRLGYAHTEMADSETLDKLKMDGFKVNPFVRYSFLKGSIGSVFIDGGVGYTYSKEKIYDIKSHELEVGFQPGVALNVSDNISLIGKFGFLGYQYNKIGDTKVNTYGLDLDLSQVQFGVNIFF